MGGSCPLRSEFVHLPLEAQQRRMTGVSYRSEFGLILLRTLHIRLQIMRVAGNFALLVHGELIFSPFKVMEQFDSLVL